MYKPASRADQKNLEYLELYNSNPFYEDISGYRLSGDIDFTFPAGAIFPGNSFIVLAKVPADVKSVYGLADVLGPYTHSLKSSGVLRLRNDQDAIYLEVPYSNQPPWPLGADGTGHSLVLARPSYGEGFPQAWGISDTIGGSPGGVEVETPEPRRSVVINEFLAHTDEPLLDYIELYNHSNEAVDISGCILTDDVKTNRFVIPSGTIMPARGFVVFDQSQLGFALSAAGESIYFKNAEATRVLDAIQFEAQANGISSGRYPDGASEIYPLASLTPGGANSPILIRDIVINEIMYKPISGNSDDQYVELYNQGTQAVDVGAWRFIAGISYTFPSNTIVPANGYLVVAKSVTNLMAHYDNLGPSNTVGNFSGKLSGQGERIALALPDQQINTNTPGKFVTNLVYVVVDEVTYGAGGRWGHWASGGGSSLELVDPRSNHRLAYNWADSDETSKAGWTTVEATGVLDNGSGPADNLQVVMLGEGECLLDNVEVLRGANGTNLIAHSTFENALPPWVPQGAHIRSSLETNEGYDSRQSLHIRASSRGDTGPNRVPAAFTSALSSGQTATIPAQARWLRGWPELVMRVHGNYLEATGRLSVPAGLGTPGTRNSRALPNAPPAIFEVTHNPVLPAANQPAVVTARAQDPDGIASLVLKYRNGATTNSTYTTLAMADDGTGGDAFAGDGIYSATIPGQASGALIAFYIQAADNHAAPATSLFPNDAPVRECLVRFGEAVPRSNFGTYRLWLTQNAVNTWVNRPVLSNERVDGTFVYGDYRVIYNMGSKYAGSPYHQGFSSPVSSSCHYSCEMPLDDLFLGTENFNKIHAPGNGPFDDNTIQREQTAYWMARQLGLPWNYRRYVAVYVNGTRKGGNTFMEDTQTPGADVIAEHFPADTEGNLFKLQPWFEFADGTTGSTTFNNYSWCTLNNYTTTGGVKKLARYRWNYLTRAAQVTANDYTSVYALTDAASTPANGPFAENMEAVADVEQWMRTFAVEHAVGNWDSFGNRNSQNMYGYKPASGKWTLFIWDYNIVLGNSGSDGPTGDNLFQLQTADLNMPKVYNHAKFQRAYWRALAEIANGPMLNANVDPVLDAKYAAFVASGLTVSSPSAIKTWISSRRSYLLQRLQTVAANFAITSNNGNEITTNKNLLTLTGTAPVDVAAIKVNGAEYPITWTTVTTWSLQLTLAEGANTLAAQGYALRGNPITNANASLKVNFVNPNSPFKVEATISSDRAVILTWTAVPGKTYRVQYKNSLDEANWSLLNTLTATGNTLSASDNPDSLLQQRFYRVERVD